MTDFTLNTSPLDDWNDPVADAFQITPKTDKARLHFRADPGCVSITYGNSHLVRVLREASAAGLVGGVS